MKLDINCVRDTLITLENWLVLNDNLEFVYLGLDEIIKSSEMLKYTRPEVAYTLVLLEEAGFIQSVIDYGSGEIYELDVIRLTFSGHQFLDAIRPQTTWNKIYEVSEKNRFEIYICYYENCRYYFARHYQIRVAFLITRSLSDIWWASSEKSRLQVFLNSIFVVVINAFKENFCNCLCIVRRYIFLLNDTI